jgi:hypothetical protein
MGRDRRYGDDGIESGHPIAAKLIRKMKQAARGKLVDLRSVVVGHAAAEELQKQVVTEGNLLASIRHMPPTFMPKTRCR